MGLVMLGSGDEDAVSEMMSHAVDQQHEKTIRALSVALALIMFNKKEQADGLIEQMCSSKDSILRYGAQFVIGMAYAGTASTQSIRRLLHNAVTDTDNDVKRAAMMNIGFLCFKDPKIIPNLVKNMADSYNPHLQYGAAMALGIGCAGTGNSDALRILAHLTQKQQQEDDFVRQGALIALSMVFIQVTEVQEPKVAVIKKLYEKMIANRYESPLTRMGALVSNGILNAAGRNCSISLTTQDGNMRQNTIAGLVLFMQHWFWYPMLNFLPLALTPTVMIGVNHKLKVPKAFSFTVKATPSTFKYPEMTKKREKEEKQKVETAVLSTTAKVKARHDRKK